MTIERQMTEVQDRAELRAALAATGPADCDPAARRMAETWLDGPRDMPLDEYGT